LEKRVERLEVGDLPGKRLGVEVRTDLLKAEDENFPEFVLEVNEKSIKLKPKKTCNHNLFSSINLFDFTQNFLSRL